MIMNKETIQAIKDSIEHWKKDIVKPFKSGKNIVINDDGYFFCWTKKDGSVSKRAVKMYDDDCPLCKMFLNREDESCGGCPLVSCSEDSVYYSFRDNQCLETAEAMVETLKGLLGDKIIMTEKTND